MEVMELTILVEARLHKTLLNTFFHLILHESKKNIVLPLSKVV